MKRAYILTSVKDNRTFWQKMFGYLPRYTATITDGIDELHVDEVNHFFLEDFVKPLHGGRKE